MSAQEVETLKGRFQEAIDALKQSRGKRGRFSLYDLPWYIIIGPPGSGKTTALLNSGLRFPLADRFGPDAVRGIGGTRDCDWWFTDDAVLIDTAGRYTTQDSDAEVDQAAWRGFLDLLKKHRKRRPINGIFVALSVADLLTQSESERRAHVRAIKTRVRELDEHFGIRFPVYLLLTKCDLLAGFNEFFADLGVKDREQVWGTTFPYSDDPQADPVAGFSERFDALLSRLDERTVDRINQEADLQRRIRIHGFPKQLALLKPLLQSFLTEAFGSSQYDATPLLRGFYLISGTQEGTPIDRLLGAMASTFQLESRALPQDPGSSGKGYFITDVLQKVAFGEAELAGTNQRVERRRAWLTNGAYVGLAVVAGLAVTGWIIGFGQVLGDLRNASAQATVATGLIADINPRDRDPAAATAALDAVRALPAGYADQAAGRHAFRFGLSQAGKLGDLARQSYRRLLEDAYLPRHILRLENRLQSGSSAPDFVFEALKVYLMLDSREHYDPTAIRAFLQVDWLNELPRTTSTEERQVLADHLDALLEQRTVPLPLPLNDAVIADARTEIRATALDERIYGRLRQLPASGRGFSLRDAAGGAVAEVVFRRRSGRGLGEPLPSLFTRNAYENTFDDASRRVTDQVADEAWWILGLDAPIDDPQQEELLRQVRERYFDDYARLYLDLIEDLRLVTFTTPDQATTALSILARDDSPLLKLLESIAHETALDVTDDSEGLARLGGRVNDAVRDLQQLIGSNEAEVTAAENPVARRFKPLRDLVNAPEGEKPPAARLLDLLNELQLYMSNVASASAGGAIPPQVQQQGQAIVRRMVNESKTQPRVPVGQLLGEAANGSMALATGGMRTHLNQQWQSEGLELCRTAIAGRYPLSRGSSQLVRLDDFTAFFGYGGTMDVFFNTHLKTMVDDTQSPWQPRLSNDVPLQLSEDALRAFEQANAIKRAYFRPGGQAPRVAFDLRPLEMDTSLSFFELNLEGRRISYEFGPKNLEPMTWPGPEPGTDVVLEVRDRTTGRTERRRERGPWAWFQLLDASTLRRTGTAEEFEITFNVGGKAVAYELTARSAFNPFNFDSLRRFRCPETL